MGWDDMVGAVDWQGLPPQESFWGNSDAIPNWVARYQGANSLGSASSPIGSTGSSLPSNMVAWNWPSNTDTTPIDTGNLDWTSVSPGYLGGFINTQTQASMADNPWFNQQQQVTDDAWTQGQNIVNQMMDTINNGAFDANAYRRTSRDMISRNAQDLTQQTLGKLANTGQVNSSLGQNFLSSQVGGYLADALQKQEMDILDKQMTDRGVNLESLAQAGALTDAYGRNRTGSYSDMTHQWSTDYQNSVNNTQNMLDMLNKYQNDELSRELDLSKFLADYVAADEV